MLWFLNGLMVAGMLAYGLKNDAPTYRHSTHFADGQFHNQVARPERSLLAGLAIWWNFLFNKPDGTVPQRAIPVKPMSLAALREAPDLSVWRLGHSGLLLKMADKFWLTDPVFSERASPVPGFGPKRWHAPPITLAELPPIETVIISHDHYDHLDRATLLTLQPKVQHFVAPLGVGARLIGWGVPKHKVQELDWWQQTRISGIDLTATPAQHFSGRGLTDGNQTLWASWVIQGAGIKLFFSGDSGYFDGFKEIGRRLGPFDIAFIETGAYDPRWEYVHMLPAQTAQAFHDLRGKWLLPIHNSTFDLAMHRWDDPLKQIARLASAQRFALATPMIGEAVNMTAPTPGQAWWRDN